MRKIITLVSLLTIVTSNILAQRVGVGTTTPTHYFHILPPIGSGDPIRIEGLQGFNTETDVLVVDPITGIIRTMPFQQLLNLDTIYFNDTSFTLLRDSLLADTLFLDSLLNLLGTDDQNIDSVTLMGTILNVYIENGIFGSVDLQPIIDSAIANSSGGTDNQNIDSIRLNGTIMTTYIENGLSANIDLQPIIDSAIANTPIGDNDWDVNANGTGLEGYPGTNVSSGAYSLSYGNNNNAIGSYTNILGGQNNSSSGSYSNNLGGFSNTSSGTYSTILGGSSNSASGNFALAYGSQSRAIHTGTGFDDFSVAVGVLDSAVGDRSVVFGARNTALGINSVIFGFSNKSTTNGYNTFIGGGNYHVIEGNGSGIIGGTTNIANGINSFIGAGTVNKTDGDRSVILGGNANVAIGNSSIVLGGFYDTAFSAFETVLGHYSRGYTPGSSTLIVPSDRLLVVGNGTSLFSRSNALTLYKNGSLEINEAYTLPNTDGTVGQVLQTNGAGVVSWANAGGGTDNQNMDSIRLNGTIMTTYIENGTSANIDLQPIIDSAIANNPSGTDDQNLTLAAGTATTSILDIENGTDITIQAGTGITLSEAGNTLTITSPNDNDWDINANGTGLEGNPGTNVASGANSIAAGNSTASGNHSVAFGQGSIASGDYSTVSGGGYGNVASGVLSTISGGETNAATALRATIAGGHDNRVSGSESVISGGGRNLISGAYSSIDGGRFDTITGSYSSIASGWDNEINATYGFIGGGNGNEINNTAGTAVIIGGSTNIASGDNTTILGGFSNQAIGNTSIVMGAGNTAQSYGEFVAGSYSTNYAASSTNSVVGSDRLFVVGNGTTSVARSNALVLYKNGSLEINEEYTLPNVDGSSNEVLTTDGSGNVSWQPVAGASPENKTFTFQIYPCETAVPSTTDWNTTRSNDFFVVPASMNGWTMKNIIAGTCLGSTADCGIDVWIQRRTPVTAVEVNYVALSITNAESPAENLVSAYPLVTGQMFRVVHVNDLFCGGTPGTMQGLYLQVTFEAP